MRGCGSGGLWGCTLGHEPAETISQIAEPEQITLWRLLVVGWEGQNKDKEEKGSGVNGSRIER